MPYGRSVGPFMPRGQVEVHVEVPGAVAQWLTEAHPLPAHRPPVGMLPADVAGLRGGGLDDLLAVPVLAAVLGVAQDDLVGPQEVLIWVLIPALEAVEVEDHLRLRL